MEPVAINVWTQCVSSRSNYEMSYWGSSVSLDEPDVTLCEGYTCGALRNYTDFCDKKIESMIEEQSAIPIRPGERSWCRRSIARYS